jgi:hypothetical protein
MSTVMYCYWIDKDKLSDFAKELSEFWKANHWIFNKARKYKFDDIMELSKNEEFHVDLQLFDVEPGKWLLRILSSGYFIQNHIDQFSCLEPCSYDDRTDIPDEDLGNKNYAEMVDKLIGKKEYYIIPIIYEVEITYNYFMTAGEKE